MKKSTRILALFLVCALLLGLSTAALAAEYNQFYPAKQGISKDRTIILRVKPDASTDAENVAATLKRVKGEAFELLGENGDWYYVKRADAEGFARKADFDLLDPAAVTPAPSPSPSPTPTPTPSPTPTATPTPQYTAFSPAKEGEATDGAIYLRADASAKAEILQKLKGVKGETFQLLGENGDWYYAQYGEEKGFVRKADFRIPSESPAPAANASQPSGDKWGKIKVSGTKINHTIYCNAISGKDYKYNKSYYNIFAMTDYGSQVSVLMGHNMRKSAGSSRSMFHDLHHVQNAFLGKSACESCGRGCSGAKTSVFDIDYQGYTQWQLLCFYETPATGAYSILVNNVSGANNPSSWISSQYSYAKTSGYKGAVVDSSGTGSDHLMVLITCGDKYGSSSTSRLYMVLKAIG